MAAPKGNKFAIGNDGGRPLKFKTVEELQEKIDKYFESCWEDVQVIGMYGPVMVDDTDQKPTEKIDKKTGETIYTYPKKIMTEYKQVRPYTISGLANALKTNRQTLLNYEDNEEYFYTITQAKSKCEQYAEEQLFLAKSSSGPAFNLKNNYSGWKDKSEQELTGANGGPIELAALNEEQRESRIKELLAKRNS